MADPIGTITNASATPMVRSSARSLPSFLKMLRNAGLARFGSPGHLLNGVSCIVRKFPRKGREELYRVTGYTHSRSRRRSKSAVSPAFVLISVCARFTRATGFSRRVSSVKRPISDCQKRSDHPLRDSDRAVFVERTPREAPLKLLPSAKQPVAEDKKERETRNNVFQPGIGRRQRRGHPAKKSTSGATFTSDFHLRR